MSECRYNADHIYTQPTQKCSQGSNATQIGVSMWPAQLAFRSSGPNREERGFEKALNVAAGGRETGAIHWDFHNIIPRVCRELPPKRENISAAWTKMSGVKRSECADRVETAEWQQQVRQKRAFAKQNINRGFRCTNTPRATLLRDSAMRLLLLLRRMKGCHSTASLHYVRPTAMQRQTPAESIGHQSNYTTSQ